MQCNVSKIGLIELNLPYKYLSPYTQQLSVLNSKKGCNKLMYSFLSFFNILSCKILEFPVIIVNEKDPCSCRF